MTKHNDVVGKIDFLGFNGQVREMIEYVDIEKMQKQISESEEYGEPIAYKWYINLPQKPLTEMDYFELQEKLWLSYNIEESLSVDLATAIKTDMDKRTLEQSQMIVDFCNNTGANIEVSISNQKNLSDVKRLFVDMDGTLAIFQKLDTLEALYEQGYFLSLPPIDNVLNAVKDIIANNSEIEVHILSAVLSDSKFALEEKNAWLDKYLPELPKENRIFTICGEDKKDFIVGGITENDYLIDDYTKNLMLWSPPGQGIKLLNGINHTNRTWQGQKLSYDMPFNLLAKQIVGIINGTEVFFSIEDKWNWLYSKIVAENKNYVDNDFPQDFIDNRFSVAKDIVSMWQMKMLNEKQIDNLLANGSLISNIVHSINVSRTTDTYEIIKRIADNRDITRNLIQINGQIWYNIDTFTDFLTDEVYYLMKNILYGDEAPNIIIDNNYNIVVENVYNGFANKNFDKFLYSNKKQSVSIYPVKNLEKYNSFPILPITDELDENLDLVNLSKEEKISTILDRATQEITSYTNSKKSLGVDEVYNSSYDITVMENSYYILSELLNDEVSEECLDGLLMQKNIISTVAKQYEIYEHNATSEINFDVVDSVKQLTEHEVMAASNKELFSIIELNSDIKNEINSFSLKCEPDELTVLHSCITEAHKLNVPITQAYVCDIVDAINETDEDFTSLSASDILAKINKIITQNIGSNLKSCCSEEHCVSNSSDVDFVNNIVVLNPTALRGEWRKAENQIYYCSSCDGNDVYTTNVFDKSKDIWKVDNIIGVANIEKLPKYIQEQVEDFMTMESHDMEEESER